MNVARWTACGLALLGLAGCGGCGGGGAAVVHTSRLAALGRDDALRIVERAEAVEGLTLADLQASRLVTVFAGAALQRLTAQVGVMAARGVRVEESAVVVVPAGWDPVALEAVLQVESRRRVVSPGDPDPGWSGAVRQWWAKLSSAAGPWRVVDEHDLAPDRWVAAR